MPPTRTKGRVTIPARLLNQGDWPKLPRDVTVLTTGMQWEYGEDWSLLEGSGFPQWTPGHKVTHCATLAALETAWKRTH